MDQQSNDNALSPLQLEDLRDPKIRLALYKYIERTMIRNTDPTSINANEIHHLHQTIQALETNIRIWNIGREEDSIPDAQPLDYDHPVFENQFATNLFPNEVDSDAETELDETEMDRLPPFAELSEEEAEEGEGPGMRGIPIYRTYSVPLRRTYNVLREDVVIVSDNDNSETEEHLDGEEPDDNANDQSSTFPSTFTEYLQFVYGREIVDTPPAEPKRFTMQRYPITYSMLKNKNKLPCNICFEVPGNMQTSVSQCCENVFCMSCINNWEESCINKGCNATCPLCRNIAPEMKIYYLPSTSQTINI